MPLFDFQCNSCGHLFEALLLPSEPPEELSCPACGEKGVRKLPAPFKTNAWSRFLDALERRVSPEKFR